VTNLKTAQDHANCSCVLAFSPLMWLCLLGGCMPCIHQPRAYAHAVHPCGCACQRATSLCIGVRCWVRVPAGCQNQRAGFAIAVRHTCNGRKTTAHVPAPACNVPHHHLSRVHGSGRRACHLWNPWRCLSCNIDMSLRSAVKLLLNGGGGGCLRARATFCCAF